MKYILIIGAGRVGLTIAKDLLKNHNVILCDTSVSKLTEIGYQFKDEVSSNKLLLFEYSARNYEICMNTKDVSLVVCAVPGHVGFELLKKVIKSGKNIVDISFFPENPFLLNELALEHNVTVCVDCGVAPGLDNMIAGYMTTKYKVNKFECLVGGLPQDQKYPGYYKAPFSPIDVIQEYIRPVYYKQDNIICVDEPLNDLSIVTFDGEHSYIPLESFSTDGLRTLINTLDIPNMIEKTLRYPGHIKFIKQLRDAGFFKREHIEFTSDVLINSWQFEPDEKDVTFFRTTVEVTDNQNTTFNVVYEFIDKADTEGNSSMSRTTGYTCTAVVEAFLQGKITQKGILAPEQVAQIPDVFPFVLDYLYAHNIPILVKQR